MKPNKNYIAAHHDEIKSEWVLKMKTIFKDYLPFPGKVSAEDATFDCSAIWWRQVVDPGYTIPFLREYDDLSSAEDDIIEEALDELGLPIDIIQ